ncbi:hypothetical protein KBB08_02055 [Candidatus Gracilibacteria bacterium]|nr:hypothetical protein [Candidatus Gracilibacteria bacterium]
MVAQCRQCKRDYEQRAVPSVEGQVSYFDPAAYCDECSNQRRLSWLNHYMLYSRPCDRCREVTIGMYRPGADYQVYCAKCWQNRDIVSLTYDDSKGFLEQFAVLLHQQPLPALLNDNNQLSVNCAYTNNLLSSKNCYFVFDGNEDEDCYYSYALGESRNCADCSYCLGSELSYELVNCHGCYHSACLLDSRLANHCYFSYDLNNCNNCLFSSGLRNKQYYIFNKPYSKDEYETYIKTELNTGNYQVWLKLMNQYQEWLLTVVRKESTNRKSENCIGNDILYSKSSTGFFMYQSEDCYNILNATTNKNCNNCFQVGYCELSSELIALENSYASFASACCQNASHNFYSLYCQNCKHVFGCIGLQNQEYCILNKQYTKDAYELLVKKIVAQMRTEKSYGQFFPPALSPFSYHETIAQDIFPLTQSQALAAGYQWEEQPLTSTHLVETSELPDNIDDTTISSTTVAHSCQTCQKLYRITEQELALYQNIQVPLPRKCFRCRHWDRRDRRPNFRMYHRPCDRCQKAIITHYPNTSALQVYCEDCYTSTVVIS